MSDFTLESTTLAIFQRHLPLITPRTEFVFAKLEASKPVTARLDFDSFPEDSRASLYDPNDKGKAKASVSFSNDVRTRSLSPEIDFDMDLSDEFGPCSSGLVTPPTSSSSPSSSPSSSSSSSLPSSSSSSSVAERDKLEKRSLSSRPDISPVAAAISPILKNGTYSAPNIHFKKTYTHLREILAEFVWTNAEIDELIDFAKSVTPEVMKQGKLAFNKGFSTGLGKEAEERMPRLAEYNERWPFLFALAVSCKLHGESAQRKEQRLSKANKSKTALALTYLK